MLKLLVVLCCATAASLAPTQSRAPAPGPSVARRGALAGGASLVAAGLVSLAPAPALAYDLAKYNRKLDKLGLPPVAGIPDGFSPVLSSVNQDQSLIVQFNHPNAWLVVKPSVNTNGESGTVSAGDYGKGDSAALYVSDLPPGGDKAFYAKLIAKGLAQKGDNQFQNFRVRAVSPGSPNAVVDFEYELLTGAGFTVERRGVAAVSGVAGKSQALLAVTTSARYKKLEPELRKIVDSFRVYDKVRSVETGALLDDD